MAANRQTGRTPAQKAVGFKKGVSGNPKGRTPVAPEVKEAAKAYTTLAIETLADEMVNGKNGASRVAAAVAMLNRGWGAPTQTIDANVNHKQDWSSMLDALDQWNTGKALTQSEAPMVIEGDVVDAADFVEVPANNCALTDLGEAGTNE
jgi:hypothetical protein